jgi:endonuclease YncB( thermonuclease family)
MNTDEKKRNGWGLTDEQVEELIRRGPPPIKTAPTRVLTVPVSERAAAAVKANPEDVRIVAKASDGTTILERPAPNPHHVTVRVDSVREVDTHGRPVYPEHTVVSEYNPLDRL